MNKNDQCKYRKLYRDVLRGYSEFKYGNKFVYIKHFNEADLGDIEAHDEELYYEAKSKGVTTEEEKLDLLIRDELWTKEKEDFIKERSAEIINLRQTLGKLIIKRQIEFAHKRLTDKEEELEDVKRERSQLLGFTVESYVEKKISSDYLKYSLFKDTSLKESFFSKEEFYDISDAELGQIALLNNAAMITLQQDDVRALAACTFFINSLAICKKNPQVFFGRPVKDMSNYQIDLFSNGLRYLSVLEEGKNPTEDALQDPKVLSKWYESMLEAKHNKSLSGHKNRKSTVGGTVMGADEQEIRNLVASQSDGDEEIVDLHKELEKRGKDARLDFGDMIEIHGHGARKNIKF